jgi:hypothetical protein
MTFHDPNPLEMCRTKVPVDKFRHRTRPEDSHRNCIQFFQEGVRIISRTIILPVVLYGCETWSLTLRE